VAAEEAQPAQPARPAGRGTFSSLSSRNYRLYFWGQMVSVSGTWMQTVAQSFLVLQLTNSGTALGLATAARFVPIFFSGRGAGWWPTASTSGACCS
jgi:hypothetical protein